MFIFVCNLIFFIKTAYPCRVVDVPEEVSQPRFEKPWSTTLHSFILQNLPLRVHHTSILMISDCTLGLTDEKITFLLGWPTCIW